jgi:hypothetical protein
MKQYLVDIDDLNLGELVEAAFEFSMENLEAFEKFLGLEETEEEQDQDEENDKEETKKEDE